MNTCYRCGLEKDDAEFHRRGHLLRNQCKACFNERYRENKRLAQARYSKSEKGKATERAYSPKRNTRIKQLGRDKVYYLVRHNIEKRPCAVCGSENAQAHHHDYARPLDVEWLCPKHHAEAHYG